MQKECDITFKITKVENTIVHTKFTRIGVLQLRSWAERINMTFPVFQVIFAREHRSIILSAHWFLTTSRSRKRTTSPTFKFGNTNCHFYLCLRFERNSILHPFQNVPARSCTHLHCERYMSVEFSCWNDFTETVFFVNRTEGERINSDSWSVDTGTMGLELMIAHFSAIKVEKTVFVVHVCSCWVAYFQDTPRHPCESLQDHPCEKSEIDSTSILSGCLRGFFFHMVFLHIYRTDL